MTNLSVILQVVLIIQLLVSCENEESYMKNVKKYPNICGGIFEGDEVNIRSPNYPRNYPQNLVCYYHIINSECTKYYTIKFLEFNIGFSEECKGTNLEIENQGILCGKKNGTRMYFGFNGNLYLKFSSNDTSVGKGFNLLISRIPCRNNIFIERGKFKPVSTETCRRLIFNCAQINLQFILKIHSSNIVREKIFISVHKKILTIIPTQYLSIMK